MSDEFIINHFDNMRKIIEQGIVQGQPVGYTEAMLDLYCKRAGVGVKREKVSDLTVALDVDSEPLKSKMDEIERKVAKYHGLS